MKNKIEERHQKAYFDWLKYKQNIYPYAIHIPNGGSRHPLEAINLKKCGVKAGVSDIFIALPMGQYHGLWIELKAPKPHKSTISEHQKDWLTRMYDIGYAAKVCYGIDDAMQTTMDYINGLPIELNIGDK